MNKKQQAQRAKARPVQQFSSGFMAKLAAISFLTGAGIEVFMYCTGFWRSVTRIEAERRAGLRD